MNNSNYTLNLLNYNLLYEINLPSKITDYDYDTNNSSRRFISTLLHKLSFYDKITNIKILDLNFSTETCYNLKHGLIKLIDDNSKSPKPFLLTIRDIYLDEMYIPSVLSMFKLPNNYIQISILNNINQKILIFNNYEIKELINLLNIEF